MKMTNFIIMTLLRFCCIVLFFFLSNSNADAQKWLNHGGDLSNTRYAREERKISPESASKLQLKWQFNATGGVSATPAIVDNTLFFPTWNGYIYAVKASDGSLVWKQYLQNLTGIVAPTYLAKINVNFTACRTTPAIAGDLLIFGTYGPAAVIAVKRRTGKFVWATLVDTHWASIITMSGTYYNGGFYIGTSSQEEGSPIEECCTFRGSFLKLDVKTGKVLWKTYMLPDNFYKTGGYSGAAIWGSSPSIDRRRNLVFIATGNLYSVPPHVEECQEKENNQTTPSHPDNCLDMDSHSETILAIDLDTGKIKWYRQLGGYDVWFTACNAINFNSPKCPIPGPYPDADFGEAPMMLSIRVNKTKKDVVAAVQKSGFAWALNRDDGSLIWTTEAGPGGLFGGGTWGSATDGKTIYTNIVNSNAKNFTLKPSNNNTNGGGWVAINASDGRIMWSTAEPSNGIAFGPVSLGNGVLFGTSILRQGPIYAMNAYSGKILWSYQTGDAVYGGASISNGCVYIGNGYRVRAPGKSLFAFCV